MRSALLVVVLIGIVVALMAFLAVGAFPPKPQEHQVQKVLPNDRFQPQH